MDTPDLRKEGAGEDGSPHPERERTDGPDSIGPEESTPETGSAAESPSPPSRPLATPTPMPIPAPTRLAIQDEEPSAIEERTSRQIRELMRALARALKAKKMYPANNPVLARIVSEFQDSIMSQLDGQEELTLSVEATELKYGEFSVYKNASKRDSLAYRFHRDGITQISFVNGLTPPEMNAFLDVLARATEPQGGEEDLVTILWEQEFSHIRYAYLAIEDLQEGLLDGIDPSEAEAGDEELREVKWPQGEVTSYNLVVDPADIGDEGSGERSDDWAQLVPAQDITERCPAQLLDITHDELQELAEEVHLEHSRPLTESALEIITEVADDEPNAERFTELARALAELVMLAVTDADFAHAAQVMATMHGMAAERGLDASTFLPDASDLLTQSMASIQHSPEADTTSLPEFLAHLGPRAVDPVCDLLHDKDLEPLQPLLASGLSLLAAQNLPRIQRRLQDATGSAARHILAAVANSPYPEANRVIALAAGHKEPRVRKEAIKALVNRRALNKPESKKCIAMALEDKDPQVRAAALLALRENPTEEIGAHLLEIVEGPRFKETPQAERLILFETLIRLPGKRTRSRLREWVTTPIWWPSSARVERRTLAARALVRSIDPSDRQLLERHARSLFPGIRKACRQALQGARTLHDTPPADADTPGDSR
jgi:hypothetical protein